MAVECQLMICRGHITICNGTLQIFSVQQIFDRLTLSQILHFSLHLT